MLIIRVHGIFGSVVQRWIEVLTCCRKMLLQNGFSDVIQEMDLMDLIATKHPKDGMAWAHRRWYLNFVGAFRESNCKRSANVRREFSVSPFTGLVRRFGVQSERLLTCFRADMHGCGAYLPEKLLRVVAPAVCAALHHVGVGVENGTATRAGVDGHARGRSLRLSL